MANFLDSTADIDLRLNEYRSRLARIEAHLRRGEKRAARARLEGFLEELIDFAREIELPLETIVVGSQVGFFTGGEFFRGRLPGAIIGAVAGWLYGQQVLQRHRLMLEVLAENVAALTMLLEIEVPEPAPPSVADPAGDAGDAGDPHDRVTMEIDRSSGESA